MILEFTGNAPREKHIRIGVNGNNLVDDLVFILSRKHGRTDLFDFTPKIKINTAEGDYAEYTDEDLEFEKLEENDTVKVTYVFPKLVTEQGNVDIEIVFEKPIEDGAVKEWQTLPVNVTFPDGIDVSDSLIKAYPNIVRELQANTKKAVDDSAAAGSTANAAKSTADAAKTASDNAVATANSVTAAEATRVSAESERAAAELARVSAEKKRQEDYRKMLAQELGNDPNKAISQKAVTDELLKKAEIIDVAEIPEQGDPRCFYRVGGDGDATIYIKNEDGSISKNETFGLPLLCIVVDALPEVGEPALDDADNPTRAVTYYLKPENTLYIFDGAWFKASDAGFPNQTITSTDEIIDIGVAYVMLSFGNSGLYVFADGKFKKIYPSPSIINSSEIPDIVDNDTFYRSRATKGKLFLAEGFEFDVTVETADSLPPNATSVFSLVYLTTNGDWYCWDGDKWESFNENEIVLKIISSEEEFDGTPSLLVSGNDIYVPNAFNIASGRKDYFRLATSAELDKSVTEITGDNKPATQGLEYRYDDMDGVIICVGIGTSTATDIVIPSTYNGLPVTRIEGCAFEGHSEITSVVLPESVKVIGDRAFYGCSLTSVTIPDGVNIINPLAFSDCAIFCESEYKVFAYDWAKNCTIFWGAPRNLVGMHKVIGEIASDIGDIDTALDRIIEIQNSLIGGQTE